MKSETLVCLVGPTATGKTALSLSLAEQVGNLEVISADSMAVYKYLDIGTAKPSVIERGKVPHHLVDFLDPSKKWSAFDFQRAVHRHIKEIQNRKGIPLVVGGTGFYLETLYRPFPMFSAPPDERFRKLLAKYSNSKLYAILRIIDPHRAKSIDNHNRPRMVRAIEIYFQTGKIPSFFDRKKISQASKHILFLGITMEKEKIVQRIYERVDDMFDRGLVEEVEHLLQRGYNVDIPAFKNFTYSPVVEYIQGKRTLTDARNKIIHGTLKYLKRQNTWYRKQPINWFRVDENNIEGLSNYLAEKYFQKEAS